MQFVAVSEVVLERFEVLLRVYKMWPSELKQKEMGVGVGSHAWLGWPSTELVSDSVGSGRGGELKE